MARPSNIERFTNGRFNPVGQLATEAVALTEPEDLYPDKALPQTDSLPNEPFLYLIHEDDCHPESLLRDKGKPASYIGALATGLRSPLDVAGNVDDFARSVVTEAVVRNGSDSALIEGDWAHSLIQAAHKHNVSHIVTAYTPTGPCDDALAKAIPELESAGINVCQLIRDWDTETWPYANRGFFKVKKKMPKVLEALSYESQLL